ncbi:methyltransferase family protein [Algoriphagus boseongensis]|uniref:Methyltransferase family protein n=1 Tax=Algoriphagus boseongensis TaxID=1442587 RepID=A0A4R6T8G3_9BACT|nr:class I SAM-dependent methyltransferase [Algoriphagus boseongensis]TDQ18509.1 methyltransferase family protein [Algoriphagus boseongensis]
MKEFWNSRYQESEYAYGTEPNEFLKEKLEGLTPGMALFPAEGEGRNAVFAAQKGWDVTAFDFSESAKVKAQKLASERGVEINYQVASFEEFEAKESSFDLLVLIFAHFLPSKRKEYHRKLSQFLKPGGLVILEAFSKNHIQFNSVNEKAGGPKDPEFLFSEENLKADFSGFEILQLEVVEKELKEGNYHVGKSSVIQMIAKKPE